MSSNQAIILQIGRLAEIIGKLQSAILAIQINVSNLQNENYKLKEDIKNIKFELEQSRKRQFFAFSKFICKHRVPIPCKVWICYNYFPSQIRIF